MKTIRDFHLKGKRVLVRVDFNTPLDEKGNIADDTRIRMTLPTLRALIASGARLILMSHLGRPNGKKDPKYSLAPCAKCLATLLGKPVKMANDCIGLDVEKDVANLRDGEIFLLENLRFHPGEENPETHPEFVFSLAKLGEFYINDAFGAAHRKHASTYSIVSFFPAHAGAGLLMEKEVQLLSSLLSHPKRPFYAIIGGAKISTKIGVLTALLNRVDGLFIGGGMAYPFLKAQGIEIGNSLCDADQIPLATSLLTLAKEKNIPLFFPIDLLIGKQFANEGEKRTILVQDGIPPGWQGMDIGPQTLSDWEVKLSSAATLFWNGPVGVFEFPEYAKGTNGLAQIIASTQAVTIVGGGDSVSAVERLHISKKFTHVSTGGGASLEFIEFGRLPGVDILVK